MVFTAAFPRAERNEPGLEELPAADQPVFEEQVERDAPEVYFGEHVHLQHDFLRRDHARRAGAVPERGPVLLQPAGALP